MKKPAKKSNKAGAKKTTVKPAGKAPLKAAAKAKGKANDAKVVAQASKVQKTKEKSLTATKGKSLPPAELVAKKGKLQAPAVAASPAGKASAGKSAGKNSGKGSSKIDKKAEILAEILKIPHEDAEVVLTNADGKKYCRVHDCDNEATTDSHCRFHYLALWKRNKIKAKILQGGKLDKYIEDLTSRYPDKYLEMLRKDLASEKDFNLIITEMDVEDSGDEAEGEEDTNRFIEEVRGGMPTPDDDESSF